MRQWVQTYIPPTVTEMILTSPLFGTLGRRIIIKIVLFVFKQFTSEAVGSGGKRKVGLVFESTWCCLGSSLTYSLTPPHCVYHATSLGVLEVPRNLPRHGNWRREFVTTGWHHPLQLLLCRTSQSLPRLSQRTDWGRQFPKSSIDSVLVPALDRASFRNYIRKPEQRVKSSDCSDLRSKCYIPCKGCWDCFWG